MSLPHLIHKIKVWWSDELLYILLVILGLVLSFYLGILSRSSEAKIPVIQSVSSLRIASSEASQTSPTEVGGEESSGSSGTGSGSKVSSAGGNKPIVASKNGTKYYYAKCSGVGRIKEENKVWFSTASDAEKAGYELAKNCAP